MLSELLIAILIGIAAGIFTGLIPGIHVNLVCTGLVASAAYFSSFFSPAALGCFIISLCVVHSFLDTIPSIYLGAPENEHALSILPGQKMLLQGEGHMAVKITILGTFCGLLLSVILLPVFMLVAKQLYPALKPYLAFLLLVLISFMILRDKDRYWAFLLFFSSGFLGVLVFSLKGLSEPLFPMLSGLFGVSALMISYFENTKIPVQKESISIDIGFGDMKKVLIGSSIAVFLIQFFPGLGPSQGAVISGEIVKGIRDRAYLALVGAMGTMSVVFSLITFYTLGKAKDGSIVALSRLVEVDKTLFTIFIIVFLLAGSISVFITFFFSRKFSSLIMLVNYKAMVVSIIALIMIMVIIINGPLGLLILVAAAGIGLIAPLKGIGRNHAMGCLLLPVLLYLMM
jgi:putative membrane protein